MDASECVKVVACPDNNCNNTKEIEQIESPVSQAAFHFGIDSNKCAARYRCEQCGAEFTLHWEFE